MHLRSFALPLISAFAVSALDTSDTAALQAAAKGSLTRLLELYKPNNDGVYDQKLVPWHESGMRWGLYMDYAKYTGDYTFQDQVIGALYNMSWGVVQDFLGGAAATYVEKIQGKWNDDILWPSQAFTGAAELYGPNAIQPGALGNWMTVPLKTVDEVWEQWDEKCGGGIYWSRDRQASTANYKSLITQLEFISQAARNFLQTRNQTQLDLAEKTYDWVVNKSGLLTSDGSLLDGMDVSNCGAPTVNQWTYNAGQFIGSMAWMNLATGNNLYLNAAIPVLNHALDTFAGSNFTGIINEQCEQSMVCNRDQLGFKAIFVRNLAYYWRQTSDQSVKNKIQTALDTSLAAMVQNNCDTNTWICAGNWTVSTGSFLDVRGQYVSAALLVSSLGIHSSITGQGLLPTTTNYAQNPTTAVPEYNSATIVTSAYPTVAGVTYVGLGAAAPNFSLASVGMTSILTITSMTYFFVFS